MNKKIIIIVGIVIIAALSSYVLIKDSRDTSSVEFGETYTSAEHGFSVGIPKGWNYAKDSTDYGEQELIIELTDPDELISFPIFIEQKSWESEISDINRIFPKEIIEETFFGGQPAIKITPPKTFAFAYHYRIQHPNQKDILMGTVASFKEGEDMAAFHELVEEILNSITF